jgi:O-acetyl-ADP-ribose deacetylase (regulator of RNase III)
MSAEIVIASSGSIFDAGSSLIANPVNCFGVMGKGLALEFRNRFPANYQAHRRRCASGEVKPGSVFVFDRGVGTSPRWIANVATKDHWRDKSRLEWIVKAGAELADCRRKLGPVNVAVPALGCGLGGLDWDDVRRVLTASLEPLDGVRVLIFAPAPALAAGAERRMAPGR